MKIRIEHKRILYGRNKVDPEVSFFKKTADSFDLDFYLVQENNRFYSLLQISYGYHTKSFYIRILNNMMYLPRRMK